VRQGSSISQALLSKGEDLSKKLKQNPLLEINSYVFLFSHTFVLKVSIIWGLKDNILKFPFHKWYIDKICTM